MADLLQEIEAEIVGVKTATAKGTYIRTVTISATMSPGIRVVA